MAETSTDRGPVLLAEDDPEMRNLIGAVLREAGFEVHEVEDGLALMAAVLSRRDFVLVVSDLQMPNLTGLGAMRRMRRLGMTVPFVLVTAFGNPRIHGEAQRLGANAVLDKPFSLLALRELALSLTESEPDDSAITTVMPATRFGTG